MTVATPAAATLGRFRLLRKLGEGGQAVVWLAHDPRLDREVALKVMLDGASPEAVDGWLHEGRAVSRLKHPGIVPVFEADRFDGRAALVFEFVPGRTLFHLAREGALPARRAVEMMLQILDALASAHAAGFVHRDLKPANVLLDEQGRPRVTDFGIAARATDIAAAAVIGTPGYLSPEAARGEPPRPSMDVFAAAVMLAELLCGRRIAPTREPMAWLRLVQATDLILPPIDSADVDDRLRAIIDRGLARDPAQRWPGAAALRDALSQWLHGGADDASTPATPVAGEQAAALEFLWRRMQATADFPGLSASIDRVHRLTKSEHDSVANLANEVLKDVALTQKLLRLVNSAQFRHAGGGNISTVSRAVALVGFGGVRNLALSLVLLERMNNRGHAAQLKTEFLRGLLAASLAGELASSHREGEELFVGALFQNLGRLLTEFYFPDEAAQVRRQVREAQGVQAPVSESAASLRALGISYDELGVAVARRWGLPEGLTAVMRRPVGDPPPRAVDLPVEQQRWVARAANEAADIVLGSEPGQLDQQLKRLGERYAKALRTEPTKFLAACEQARQRLSHLAEALDLRVDKHVPAERLLAAAAPAVADDEMATITLQATIASPRPEPPRAAASQQLAAGIQDITDAMVESNDPGAVLRMILETIYRALGLQRVLLALRDPRSEALTGRFGLGEGIERKASRFRVPLRLAPGQAPDLFAAVCLRGADTLITDTSQGSIAARLPAWWRADFGGGSFVVLPLMQKTAPFGLIYAEAALPGAIQLEDRELSMLRTLRNQAVMAFRQSGS